VKFFPSASAEERARRRYEELTAKGEQVTLADTIDDVIRRDRQDSERDIAPLRQADDALLIDSSRLSIDEVLARMAAVCRDKIESVGSAR
jgi:cytidylate kinase